MTKQKHLLLTELVFVNKKIVHPTVTEAILTGKHIGGQCIGEALNHLNQIRKLRQDWEEVKKPLLAKKSDATEEEMKKVLEKGEEYADAIKELNEKARLVYFESKKK